MKTTLTTEKCPLVQGAEGEEFWSMVEISKCYHTIKEGVISI